MNNSFPFKPQFKLIMFIQLISLILLTIGLVTTSPRGITDSDLSAIGESLSLILIVLGIFGYLAAKKGPVQPFILIGIGAIAPAFSLIGGRQLYVLNYAIIAFGMHGLILWRQQRHSPRKKDESIDPS